MTNETLLHLSFKKDGLALQTSAFQKERALTTDALRQMLFFDDFDTYFGQTITGHDGVLTVPLYDAMRRFGDWQHPYVTLLGKRTSDKQLLEQLSTLWKRWNDPETWQSLSITSDHMFSFGEEDDVLSTLLEAEAHLASFTREDREALLPYLQTYGWQRERPTSLRLALRLVEPDEGDHWVLETVIPKKDGTYWTPSKANRKRPWREALPEKWQPFAEEIARQQQEMDTIAHSFHLPHDHFLYETFTDRDVHLFLKRDVALLRAFHFPIIIPAWLRQLTEAKVMMRGEAMAPTKAVASFDDIIDFNWSFSIDGQPLDEQTFYDIVKSKRSFVQLNDEWYYVDNAALNRLRALLEQAEANDWTVKDLLLHQTPVQQFATEQLDDEDDDVHMSFMWHESLKHAMKTLRDKDEIPTVPIPDNLHATLRPYQIDGYEWLLFMREEQFGACLADDMGLGKTVQLISYLLYVHRTNDTPSIIICPTSVLGNWQDEIARFAPSLNVYIHYGSDRKHNEAFFSALQDGEIDIVLTTYGIMTQDIEQFRPIEWTTVALDEAQNIKNRKTKQSRAIRELRGAHHIALTGTPIENRLAELWSIFDFLNPGYFGSFHKFTNDFIIPIERDDLESTREQLRLKIEPFLLRRTKRDTNLALNLPQKHENEERCPLTTEQAALYESYIQDAKDKMQHAPPFERKGIVLAMLNRLKQLCNHPILFLKEEPTSSEDIMRRSIKLQRIVNRAIDIVERGEKALIFTQYIGMGELIQYVLEEQFDLDVPFLTGQMRKEERDELVQSFQRGDFPLFLLSLRAGGTGLNLTAANHVLHADRWWNPAVEEQATDRAYRIGQTQFVHVVKFMTIGTIEEKIDKMLLEKSALSDNLIQSSQWITELDDDEIDDLFSLDM